MALRFFWPAENTTVTTGGGYSIGDTTASLTGAAAIGTTGVKVGTNGISTTDASDYYTFDTTTTLLGLIDEGAAGFWVKFVSAMPGFTADIGIGFHGDTGATTKAIKSRVNATVASVYTYDDAGTSQNATATGTSMSADTWYFVVIRWDFPNDKLGVEVYTGTDETPIQSAENTSATGTPPTELNNSAGVRIGNMSSITSVMYFDNIFIADTYDEPLHLNGNRDITDIDSYRSGGPLLIPQYDRAFRQNTLLRL